MTHSHKNLYPTPEKHLRMARFTYPIGGRMVVFYSQNFVHH